MSKKRKIDISGNFMKDIIANSNNICDGNDHNVMEK